MFYSSEFMKIMYVVKYLMTDLQKCLSNTKQKKRTLGMVCPKTRRQKNNPVNCFLAESPFQKGKRLRSLIGCSLLSLN